MEVIVIDSPQFAVSGSAFGRCPYARKRSMKMASPVGERACQLALLCVDSHVKFRLVVFIAKRHV